MLNAIPEGTGRPQVNNLLDQLLPLSGKAVKATKSPVATTGATGMSSFEQMLTDDLKLRTGAPGQSSSVSEAKAAPQAVQATTDNNGKIEKDGKTDNDGEDGKAALDLTTLLTTVKEAPAPPKAANKDVQETDKLLPVVEETDQNMTSSLLGAIPVMPGVIPAATGSESRSDTVPLSDAVTTLSSDKTKESIINQATSKLTTATSETITREAAGKLTTATGESITRETAAKPTIPKSEGIPKQTASRLTIPTGESISKEPATKLTTAMEESIPKQTASRLTIPTGESISKEPAAKLTTATEESITNQAASRLTTVTVETIIKEPAAKPTIPTGETITNQTAAASVAILQRTEKATPADRPTVEPLEETNSNGEANLTKNFREALDKVGVVEVTVSKGEALKVDVKKDFSLGDKSRSHSPEVFATRETTDTVDVNVNRAGALPGKGQEVAVPMAHVLEQVAEQLPLAASKGSGRVRLTLAPENLGKLDMDLVVRENRVQIILTAESRTVQQALQGSVEQLKDALQQQGLKVDGFSVLLQNGRNGQGDTGGGHPFWSTYNNSAAENKGAGDDDSPIAAKPFLPGQNRLNSAAGINIFV